MNLKKCVKCKVKQPLTQFAKNKTYTSGYNSTCKSCIASYYQKNKIKLAKQKKAYYDKNPQQLIDNNARNLAKRRTKPHYYRAIAMQNNLKYKIKKGVFVDSHFRNTRWLESKLKTVTYCPACGVKFVFSDRRKKGDFHIPNAPSLDRFNPKLGYTLENVKIICYSCNIAKGVITDGNQLIKLGKWINAQN